MALSLQIDALLSDPRERVISIVIGHGGALAVDRFATPLYTVSEAARHLSVSSSTFRNWAKGYNRVLPSGHEVHGDPVVTTVRADPRAVSVPFVGLAEGLVLAGIRQSGVPLQRIRPALDRLSDEFGLEHVLASRRMFTDGAEVLWDFGSELAGTEEAAATRQLVVIRNGQRVFTEVVERYLRRIEFDADGYAGRVQLPQYRTAEIVIDPQRGFGQPVFARGGVRVEDAFSMFWAGETLAVVSDEFGIPEDQLEDALRVASHVVAA